MTGRIRGAPLDDLALAGASLDRAAHRRTDDAWLATRWADPTSRVVAVDRDGATPVAGDPPRLRLLAPAALGDVPPADRWLLGVDDGVAVFAVPATAPAEGDGPGEGATAALREVGALLGARDGGLLATAVGLARWHAGHRFCPRCGAATTIGHAGWNRACTDGHEQHPRTDPAVIMAVVDDDDRLLLGHQASWPERRFSTLAGFVEPGESLEQTVAREVHEEVGVVVDRATYMGSQPWPFPRSLMLGFTAHATTTELSPDGVEIGAARWFARDELRSAVAAGDVLLPPRISIARHLVEHWLGDAVDQPAADAW